MMFFPWLPRVPGVTGVCHQANNPVTVLLPAYAGGMPVSLWVMMDVRCVSQEGQSTEPAFVWLFLIFSVC